MPTACIIAGCRSGYACHNDSRHYFRPPSDATLLKKWDKATCGHRQTFALKAIHKVCDLHFADEFIVKCDKFVINNETVKLSRRRWTLKDGAVPHIFPALPPHLAKLLPRAKKNNSQTIQKEVKKEIVNRPVPLTSLDPNPRTVTPEDDYNVDELKENIENKPTSMTFYCYYCDFSAKSKISIRQHVVKCMENGDYLPLQLDEPILENTFLSSAMIKLEEPFLEDTFQCSAMIKLEDISSQEPVCEDRFEGSALIKLEDISSQQEPVFEDRFDGSALIKLEDISRQQDKVLEDNFEGSAMIKLEDLSSQDPLFEDTFQSSTIIKLEDKSSQVADSSVPRPLKSSDGLISGNIIQDSKMIKLEATPLTQTPLDVFRYILDDTILDMIVKATNTFAESLKLKATPGARISRWKPLTLSELLVFIGLLFHTGTIKLAKLKEYWSTASYFGGLTRINCFPEIMGRDRFFAILRCLHFSPNLTNGKCCLYKLCPLIKYFNSKIKEIYYPGSQDEHMFLYRGCLSFRQFIHSKRCKTGIKLYSLANQKGMPIKFWVSCESGASFIEHEVKYRIDNLDKMCNCDKHANDPLEEQTHEAETLHANQQSASRFQGECLLNWQDKREVLMIYSESTGELIEFVSKTKNEQAIEKYNQSMTAVDSNDQLLSYYPCESNYLEWHKKLGIHILQLLLNASYYFFNIVRRRQNMALHDFRLYLILGLTSIEYENRPRQASVEYENRPKQADMVAPAPISVIGHFPRIMVMRNNKRAQLRCRHCAKKTSYFCSICKEKGTLIGLCVLCFEPYHSSKLFAP